MQIYNCYYFLFSLKDQRKHQKQNNSKNHQCPECGKGFSTEQNLRLHSQYHTGKFSYYCGQCRRGFYHKSHYDEHMRKHEGRGYACEYCPGCFRVLQVCGTICPNILGSSDSLVISVENNIISIVSISNI